MEKRIRHKQKRGPRALVTGATGFIGSHLVERLVEEGFRVRCLVRAQSDRRWIEDLDVEFVVGDVMDATSLDVAVKDMDMVFHLAAKSSAWAEEDIYQTNTAGTVNLIKAIIKINPGIQRFVYLSSLTAAGPSLDKAPVTEVDMPHPVAPYGASKLAGEEALMAFYPQLSCVIVRPAVVYGPRSKTFYTFHRWIRKGIRPILGFRKRYCSYIYIDDFIDGIMAAATNPKALGQTYFLVSETYVTYHTVTRLIAAAMGKRTFPLYTPATLLIPIVLFGDLVSRMLGLTPRFSWMKLRELSPRYWVCAGEKAVSDLDFEPQVSLEEGIRRTSAWYRTMGWI